MLFRSTSEPTYWKWLAAFFACLWLITLLFLFKKPKTSDKNSANKIKCSQSKHSIASARNTVIKNAKQNNPGETKAALIRWAQLNYKNKELSNLTQICQQCSNQLSQQIRQLNQALYSPEKPSWNGEKMLSVFKNEQTLMNRPGQQQNSSLKPLYLQ